MNKKNENITVKIAGTYYVLIVVQKEKKLIVVVSKKIKEIKEIGVIIKPIFAKMVHSNFFAYEYGIECFKKGMEYQGIKELAIENDNLIRQVRTLEAQIEKMKNWCNCKNYQQCLIELAEQGKGMKHSECCVNCKKWELDDYIARKKKQGDKRK